MPNIEYGMLMQYLEYCWGVSPTDGLVLMWHIPAKLSSEQSQQAVTENGNIHDCVKLRRGFSQLSFMYVLFSFNIFLITHFWVVLSFEPPLDHQISVGVIYIFSISSHMSLVGQPISTVVFVTRRSVFKTQVGIGTCFYITI